MTSLLIIILTYNEELHIERAIKSLKFANLDASVMVVDSGSDDQTRAIADDLGAFVVTHKYVSQSQQLNWALSQITCDFDWLMRLDADEVLSEALSKEISKTLPRLSGGVCGMLMKRQHFFWDRWIRFGGRYPLWLLRVWRPGAAHVETRWMDEHMILDKGVAGRFRYPFADVNLNPVGFFTDKHNSYADREAVEALAVMYPAFGAAGEFRGLTRQALLRRRLKTRVYYRLPFGVGPTLYFSLRYFVQLGFLDGAAGFSYHFFQAFWYRMLVDAKVRELRKLINSAKTSEDAISRVRTYTGLPGVFEVDSSIGEHS